MKLTEGLNIEILKDYDFHKITEDYKREHNLDETPIKYMYGWIYNMGHSRRGQFYYLICSNEGNFSIVATKPDGGGGAISLEENDIFSKLFADSIACS